MGDDLCFEGPQDKCSYNKFTCVCKHQRFSYLHSCLGKGEIAAQNWYSFFCLHLLVLFKCFGPPLTYCLCSFYQKFLGVLFCLFGTGDDLSASTSLELTEIQLSLLGFKAWATIPGLKFFLPPFNVGVWRFQGSPSWDWRIMVTVTISIFLLFISAVIILVK
jgi:hypothetical protein